jgi:hypothetical protein
VEQNPEGAVEHSLKEAHDVFCLSQCMHKLRILMEIVRAILLMHYPILWKHSR